MTKRDYKIIAREIALQRNRGILKNRTLDALVDALADRFLEENPRFNRDTFNKAAEYTSE